MVFVKLQPLKKFSIQAGTGVLGYAGSNIVTNILASKINIPGGKLSLGALKVLLGFLVATKAKGDSAKAIGFGAALSGFMDITRTAANTVAPSLVPLLGMDINSFNRNMVLNGNLRNAPATRALLDATNFRGNRMGMDLSPGTRDYVLHGDRDPYASQLPIGAAG